MHRLTFIECSHVVPQPLAPGSPTRLPLTFLDLPWLFFPPSQQLFFYDYPHSPSDFLSSALPQLKSSLSLALRIFFPLCGELHASPGRRPAILCFPHGHTLGITLTVAESNDDFHDICHDREVDGDHFLWTRPRAASRFHPLVPALAAIEGNDPALVMAIKITVFPWSGFSVGIAYDHAVADGRTFKNFLKAWTDLCKSSLTGDEEGPVIDPPEMDRTIIRDVPTLYHKFLNEWWQHRQHQLVFNNSPVTINNMTTLDPVLADDGLVRSTFVVIPAHMEMVRSWITGHCDSTGLPLPVHMSPYVLTCSLLWPVRLKTHVRHSARLAKDATSYFGFIAGGISRVGYNVPGSYFGNCIGFGRAEAACAELLGEDGVFYAASAIASAIKRLDRSMLEGAEKWISEWREMSESGGLHVMVTGSPKVDLYNTDFGWGSPRKIEEMSIDRTGAISLRDSRDAAGGIEVGVSLSKAEMDTFIDLLLECLPSLSR